LHGLLDIGVEEPVQSTPAGASAHRSDLELAPAVPTRRQRQKRTPETAVVAAGAALTTLFCRGAAAVT